jgi:hypothetical protein
MGCGGRGVELQKSLILKERLLPKGAEFQRARTSTRRELRRRERLKGAKRRNGNSAECGVSPFRVSVTFKMLQAVVVGVDRIDPL